MAKRKVNIEQENGTTVISGTKDEIMDTIKGAISKVQADNASKKSGVEIKKAKIKDDLFLEVEYSEEVKDGVNQVKKSCTAPVHDDLKTSFEKLDAHLCELCEQFNSECISDISNVTCKGFTIGGNGDSEGVTLIGSRELESGKLLNLVSPFYKWADEDYPEINDLAAIIEECKHEVHLYLFVGKHKPEAQQELPFGDASYSEDEL
jgi:hypothetical protein